MKPFIQAERERLQRADKALSLMERKLRIAHECEENSPLLSLKLLGQAENHYQEYEQIKSEILKAWQSEKKPVREDMVTIAEDHYQK